MQQAFIISTLSVNNSLNALTVVGQGKEFLAPIEHNTVWNRQFTETRENRKTFVPAVESKLFICYIISVVYT